MSWSAVHGCRNRLKSQYNYPLFIVPNNNCFEWRISFFHSYYSAEMHILWQARFASHMQDWNVLKLTGGGVILTYYRASYIVVLIL